jgi:poly(hydroxyalkanoate) depolymerase family esterase
VQGDPLRALGALALAGALLLGGAPGGEGSFQRGTHAGRVYRLYVPRAVVAGSVAPAPLIVALHGCWQTPEDFAVGTRLNEAAERRSLLVLYPAQARSANPSRCWNWFEPPSRERGEVAVLLELIEQVAAGQPVDRERVLAIGLSAGGFMAINLACTAPDVVRGVGVAAGGPYRCGLGAQRALECMRGQHEDGRRAANACRAAMGPHPRPPRASLWHGADDQVVSALNLESLTRMFAVLHGRVTPTTERVDAAAHTVYRDARGRAVLETWLVQGMGHAWSGGDRRGTHTFPPGPPATARMLDFLLARE